jgi:hypothetical protein
LSRSVAFLIPNCRSAVRILLPARLNSVFEYWTQNQDLSVKLSVHPAEDGATAALNEGPILFVRVHNQRHRATVPFDERSRGFVKCLGDALTGSAGDQA